MARNNFGLKSNKITEILVGSEKKKKSCPKTIKDQLRHKYWKGKYEGPCFCCGKKIEYSENMETGRIKAGGEYSVQNTRLICRTCNKGMGKQNLKVYMKRNYPKRYKTYFPVPESKDTKKSKIRKSKGKSKKQAEILKLIK